MKSAARFTSTNTLRIPILYLIGIYLAGATGAAAQQKSLSPEKRAEIERAVSSFMSANSVPGIGAAVVLDGEPAWSAGFGMADLENYSPATSSTLWCEHRR